MQLTFTRVFYFLDVSAPQKMEVLCSQNDKIHPDYYNVASVPPALTHQYSLSLFNSGKYKLVCRMKNCAVYFYAFDSTKGASEITRRELDLTEVYEKKGTIKEVLPRCPSSSKKFPTFKVPEKFYGEPDVILLIEQVKQESKRKIEQEMERRIRHAYGEQACKILQNIELSQPSETSPSSAGLDAQGASVGELEEQFELEAPSETSPAGLDAQDASEGGQFEFEGSQSNAVQQLMRELKLDGVEDMRNRRFAVWLRKNLGPDFIVNTDEKLPTGTDYYSRFSRSKQDFNFMLKNVIYGNVQAVAISEESDNEDYKDVHALAGDGKELPKSDDRNQLIANMTKTAADVAYATVKAHALFNSITVYGFLLNYRTAKANNLCKLIFDFQGGKKPELIECEDDLDIEDAVQRAYTLCNLSITAS